MSEQPVQQGTQPPIYEYADMGPVRQARKGEAAADGAWLYGCVRCSGTVYVTQEAHRGRHRIRCGQCARERADA